MTARTMERGLDRYYFLNSPSYTIRALSPTKSTPLKLLTKVTGRPKQDVPSYDLSTTFYYEVNARAEAEMNVCTM